MLPGRGAPSDLDSPEGTRPAAASDDPASARPTPRAPARPNLSSLSSFGSLLAAFHRARRAKRGRGGEPDFYFHLEARLLALSEQLLSMRWEPDPYRFFRLRNRKERIVAEASFRDRVVHHALVAALEPVFERRFIAHSYACRQGRGQHGALERVRSLSRRHPIFLRLDVRRYFDNVSHSVLLRLLAARVDDPGVLWLCERILAYTRLPHLGAPVGIGLPIGNLTSQFWANVYLDPLDQRAVCRLGLGTYTRYMDDVAVFGPDKAGLWEAAHELQCFAAERLGLEMKRSATVVAPVTDGVPWLGWRVFPGTVRLERAGRRRLGRRLAGTLGRVAAGSDPAWEAARASSAVGHALCGSTLALRRSMLARLRPGA